MNNFPRGEGVAGETETLGQCRRFPFTPSELFAYCKFIEMLFNDRFPLELVRLLERSIHSYLKFLDDV